MPHIRVRELDGVKSALTAPTPEQLALLAGPEFAGGEVTAEDVTVRQMLLCHDQYDRTYERFPKPYLARFAETLPGKSVLPGHNSDELPLARFFNAAVESRRERDFPTLQTQKSEVVPGFEPQAKTVHYLVGDFYYPADAGSQALDNRIRLGVYRSVSIGFRYDDVNCDVCRKSYFSDCPHYRGQWTEEGRLVTLTYSGDTSKAEALEGSIVYLGAQPNARLLKSMTEAGQVDPGRAAWTMFGEDLVTLKEAEHLARRFGHQRKSWHFPALGEKETSMNLLERLRKALGLADTATEDEAVTAAEKAATDAKSAAEVPALKTAAETAAKREPLAKIGETALTDQSAAYVGHVVRLGGSETEAKAVAELLVNRGDYAGLKSLVEAKFAEVCAKFPTAPSGDPGEKEDKPAVRQSRARDFDL